MSEKKPPKPPVERAAAYVSKMDAAIQGAGGDKQTFLVACKLVEFGLNQDEAMKVLKEYNERCQPKWDDYGLERKLKYAFHHASPDPEFCDPARAFNGEVHFKERKVQTWPDLDERLRQNICSQGFGMFELYESSPVSFDPGSPATMEVLRLLFPGNPLICAGWNSTRFRTVPMSEHGDCSGYQLIVPSPMDRPVGKIKIPRKDGSQDSQHSLDNTGPRRYAVIEFDSGKCDDHAALLNELAKYGPFVMAVHSGGKSLHGWFLVSGQPEERVHRFYRYAVSLGADHATFLKSQFVRMPDGLRSNGNRQPIYYFNPKPLERLCPKN